MSPEGLVVGGVMSGFGALVLGVLGVVLALLGARMPGTSGFALVILGLLLIFACVAVLIIAHWSVMVGFMIHF